MNCEQLQSRLDDLLDNALPAQEHQALQIHVAGCSSCQARVAEEQALRNRLRDLPVPLPTAGFADRALRIAIQRNSRRHHRAGFIKGFGLAVAAGLALWVVVGVVPVSNSPTLSVPEISIALYQTENVRLAFNSVRELNGATITIELPENVMLAGYEGRRELTWRTDLHKGDNVLTLPIKAQAVAKGRLLARIEHESQIRFIEIAVDVKGSGMTMEPLPMKTV